MNRANIYSSVLELCSQEDITKCFPLQISFEGERAIDVGGVFRDMLSGFWGRPIASFLMGGVFLVQ